MPTPDELEQAADRLRGCARSGRTAAQSLATHIDTVVTTSADSSVWKGTYPTKAATDLKGDQGALGRAATQLREDAAAWDKKAADLDEQASHQRSELKKKQAQEKQENDSDKVSPR